MTFSVLRIRRHGAVVQHLDERMSAGFLQCKVMIPPFVIDRYLMAKPFTILKVWVTRRNGWPSADKRAPCRHFQFFLDEMDQKLFQDFTVLLMMTALWKLPVALLLYTPSLTEVGTAHL